MNFLKNLKISSKLGLGFGLIILILLVLSGSIISVLNKIDNQGKDLTESLKLSDGINEAKYNLTWDKQIIMEVLASETREEVAEQVAAFNKANKDFDDNITAIQEVGSDVTWGKNYADQKEKIAKFSAGIDEKHNKDILPLIEKLHVKKIELIAIIEKHTQAASTDSDGFSQNFEALNKELKTTDKTLDEMIDAINESLLKTEDDIAEIVNGTSEATNDLVSFSTLAIIVTSIICLVVAILIGMAITNVIAKPVKSAVIFAEKIANGDLTATINLDQQDEVGDLTNSLRKMILKLQEVIGSVITASQNISSASNQMSSSAQQMSEGATEQASSVEEISSSMEEMAANIQQNTNNSKQTEKIATHAAKDIYDGNEAVNNTVNSMKTIAGKISIIGEISRQTNLLALNAAVEAARAGEHGKGFAVVAAEVRKLAERSQLAATEINDVSAKSVDVAQKSGELLKTVVPNIQKTADLVQEITASSVEQNAGADQINNAIQQLNQVVQENAATAEEMAAGSEELNAQAENLKDIVSFFRIDSKAMDAATSPKKTYEPFQPGVTAKTNAIKDFQVSKTKQVTKPKLKLNDIDSKEAEYESF
jgi:methyl-accepting chemotaxis protein